MTVQFERAVPIFRIFSLDKAREFYLDFLGFKVDWEIASSRARRSTCRSPGTDW